MSRNLIVPVADDGQKSSGLYPRPSSNFQLDVKNGCISTESSSFSSRIANFGTALTACALFPAYHVSSTADEMLMEPLKTLVRQPCLSRGSCEHKFGQELRGGLLETVMPSITERFPEKSDDYLKSALSKVTGDISAFSRREPVFPSVASAVDRHGDRVATAIDGHTGVISHALIVDADHTHECGGCDLTWSHSQDINSLLHCPSHDCRHRGFLKVAKRATREIGHSDSLASLKFIRYYQPTESEVIVKPIVISMRDVVTPAFTANPPFLAMAGVNTVPNACEEIHRIVLAGVPVKKDDGIERATVASEKTADSIDDSIVANDACEKAGGINSAADFEADGHNYETATTINEPIRSCGFAAEPLVRKIRQKLWSPLFGSEAIESQPDLDRPPESSVAELGHLLAKGESVVADMNCKTKDSVAANDAVPAIEDVRKMSAAEELAGDAAATPDAEINTDVIPGISAAILADGASVNGVTRQVHETAYTCSQEVPISCTIPNADKSGDDSAASMNVSTALDDIADELRRVLESVRTEIKAGQTEENATKQES